MTLPRLFVDIYNIDKTTWWDVNSRAGLVWRQRGGREVLGAPSGLAAPLLAPPAEQTQKDPLTHTHLDGSG